MYEKADNIVGATKVQSRSKYIFFLFYVVFTIIMYSNNNSKRSSRGKGKFQGFIYILKN